MNTNDYEIVSTDWGLYACRPNTSDEKAVNEVIVKHGYENTQFKIGTGENWIDIGGNIGAFSCLAALKGNRVTAFEPDPVHIEIFRHNAFINSVTERITLIEKGAGIRNETQTFYKNTAKGNTWRNSFFKAWKGGEKSLVDIVNVMPYFDVEINLKLDAEGAEKEILIELIETGKIANLRKIAFEWSFDILPETKPYIWVIEQLRKTHNLFGSHSSDRYLEKLGEHVTYPASWFPPAAKVFGLRK